MIQKIKELIKKIKYNCSREGCYDQMEYAGIAAMGSCCGLVGGDASTEYLQYACTDCPHFVDLTK
jgi:hypothetical protein